MNSNINFKRAHYHQLISRLKEPRHFLQVILGPRQVGKTTLIHQVLADWDVPAHFASADDATNSQWLHLQWDTAEVLFKNQKSKEFLLVIDEIQKIPDWSEIVKARWDANTRSGMALKVVLLGSSRLLLQQGLTESLAGRFETIFMGHWTLSEMESAFDITPDQFIWYGGYPGAARLINDEKRWKQYVKDALIDTSIARDILLLTRIEKPALLRNLFQLGCTYSGQILAFNKMLGQLTDSGNTTTLAHYLALLDTAGLLGGLEKYSGTLIRQRGSSPKFQVYNTALITAQRHEAFSQAQLQPERWGRLVESAVGAHLLNAARQHAFELQYWREGTQEVDFIVKNGDTMVALEVKSGRSGQHEGLAAFQKKFGRIKSLLVGQEGMPWANFLRMDPGELLG